MVVPVALERGGLPWSVEVNRRMPMAEREFETVMPTGWFVGGCVRPQGEERIGHKSPYSSLNFSDSGRATGGFALRLGGRSGVR